MKIQTNLISGNCSRQVIQNIEVDNSHSFSVSPKGYIYKYMCPEIPTSFVPTHFRECCAHTYPTHVFPWTFCGSGQRLFCVSVTHVTSLCLTTSSYPISTSGTTTAPGTVSFLSFSMEIVSNHSTSTL